MAWHDHHKFSYSEAERRKTQNTEEILKSLGLKPGMNFVDIGCNDGYFCVPAAKIVGTKGQVIAIDTDESAISRLEQKLEFENITNTITIIGRGEDVVAYKNKADIIFFGSVLHDFDDPVKVLKNAKAMLKENGLIFDYDWKKDQQSENGPPLDIRLSIEEVTEMANKSGLSVNSSVDFSQNFYLISIAHNNS